MKNENLYGWVFTFNPYTQVWNAAKSENYTLMFSATSKNSKKVLKSKDINTLIELIIKTDGEPAKLNKLVANQIKHVIVH
jgi:hypothetical protein